MWRWYIQVACGVPLSNRFIYFRVLASWRHFFSSPFKIKEIVSRQEQFSHHWVDAHDCMINSPKTIWPKALGSPEKSNRKNTLEHFDFYHYYLSSTSIIALDKLTTGNKNANERFSCYLRSFLISPDMPPTAWLSFIAHIARAHDWYSLRYVYTLCSHTIVRSTYVVCHVECVEHTHAALGTFDTHVHQIDNTPINTCIYCFLPESKNETKGSEVRGVHARIHSFVYVVAPLPLPPCGFDKKTTSKKNEHGLNTWQTKNDQVKVISIQSLVQPWYFSFCSLFLPHFHSHNAHKSFWSNFE